MPAQTLSLVKLKDSVPVTIGSVLTTADSVISGKTGSADWSAVAIGVCSVGCDSGKK